MNTCGDTKIWHQLGLPNFVSGTSCDCKTPTLLLLVLSNLPDNFQPFGSSGREKWRAGLCPKSFPSMAARTLAAAAFAWIPARYPSLVSMSAQSPSAKIGSGHRSAHVHV